MLTIVEVTDLSGATNALGVALQPAEDEDIRVPGTDFIKPLSLINLQRIW
jgi:hypothetical protein